MRTNYNPRSPFIKDNENNLIIPHALPPALPVVCVLTHLPNKQGYHAERWDIVMSSLTLARQNAGVDHHLVVWDNGSAPEFLEWLMEFKPDSLILSKNVGVMNAMHSIMRMYVDCVVSWCNDDLIYYPNWLQPQVDILKHFPNAASVTGCVTRFYSGRADDNTLKWARDNAKLSKVDTPMEWDIQHGESIGKKNVANMYVGAKVPQIEYNGVKALVGGNHCQMTVRPVKILPHIGNTNLYMHPLFQTIDMGVNDAGDLRLMTTERLTRHIGNVMSDEDRKEIDELVD